MKSPAHSLLTNQINLVHNNELPDYRLRAAGETSGDYININIYVIKFCSAGEVIIRLCVAPLQTSACVGEKKE